MQQHESPETAFRVFFDRFEKPPKYVVYDNNCHAMKYSLKRELKFFHAVRFFIDRLHWKNHTACQDAYNMNTWPFLKGVNSQACEQFNSRLLAIATQLGFFTADRGMEFMYMFVRMHNEQKLGSMSSEHA